MSHTPARIVPSVLPADQGRLGEVCEELEAAGADRIQWDVMDGRFVPNLTFGPDVIADCRKRVGLGFEAHLMCERPEELLARYVEAGCELVICHPETLRQPHRELARIREMGARAGVAVSPGTPLAAVEWLVELCDIVVVMTVNPGFGGQAYLASMEAKVAAAARLLHERGVDAELEVDGGVGPDTIAGAATAGATTFVSGSALWRYATLADGVADLRARAEQARA